MSITFAFELYSSPIQRRMMKRRFRKEKNAYKTHLGCSKILFTIIMTTKLCFKQKEKNIHSSDRTHVCGKITTQLKPMVIWSNRKRWPTDEFIKNQVAGFAYNFCAVAALANRSPYSNVFKKSLRMCLASRVATPYDHHSSQPIHRCCRSKIVSVFSSCFCYFFFWVQSILFRICFSVEKRE